MDICDQYRSKAPEGSHGVHNHETPQARKDPCNAMARTRGWIGHSRLSTNREDKSRENW